MPNARIYHMPVETIISGPAAVASYQMPVEVLLHKSTTNYVLTHHFLAEVLFHKAGDPAVVLYQMFVEVLVGPEAEAPDVPYPNWGGMGLFAVQRPSS
jgi:hypothetical protein